MGGIIDGGCMLMALTAVAVMACRPCSSRQLTTATALASLRNASFVCAASCSVAVIPACIVSPNTLLLWLTLYRTVRYSVLYVTVNRGRTQSKTFRLNLHGAPVTKSDAESIC